MVLYCKKKKKTDIMAIVYEKSLANEDETSFRKNITEKFGVFSTLELSIDIIENGYVLNSGQITHLKLDGKQNPSDSLEGIQNLSKLKYLDLKNFNFKNNFLNFEGLENLSILKLTNCLIQTLPDWIGSLTNLTKLILSDNDISSVPDSIGNLQSLIKLNLSGNNLNDIGSSVTKLENLKKLKLNRNKFTTIPDSVNEVRDGTLVDLTENQIHSLPTWIKDKPLLVLHIDIEIKFYDNSMQFKPPYETLSHLNNLGLRYKMAELKNVNKDHNYSFLSTGLGNKDNVYYFHGAGSTVDYNFKLPNSVKTFDMSGMQLKMNAEILKFGSQRDLITKFIGKDLTFGPHHKFMIGFRKLEYINLEGSDFRAFNLEFEPNMVNVKYLNLRKSKIASFHPNFDDPKVFQNLETLLLDGSTFSVFSPKMKTYPKLKRISAKNCNIQWFWGLATEGPTLETLHISDNKITKFDKFGKGGNLKEFVVSNCQIKKLPKNMSKLENLEILDLSENGIGKLSKDFKKFSGLKILRMHGNNLKEFPVEIFENSNLESVTLDDIDSYKNASEIRHALESNGLTQTSTLQS